MPHKYFCKKDCKFWNNNVVNPAGLQNCGKPSGDVVHVVGMDCQSYVSSNNIKVSKGKAMEINEKTLKAFITKRKKNIIRARGETLTTDIYHWWCGYQELVFELEMFLEGTFSESLNATRNRKEQEDA